MESALECVEQELYQIQALGNMLGNLMFGADSIDQEHIGTLCYLVFHLGKTIEEKLDNFGCTGGHCPTGTPGGVPSGGQGGVA
jgi:hypothetical protein